MNQSKRGVAGKTAAAVMLGVMALAMALGLLAGPANAQTNSTSTTQPAVGAITYPIIGPSGHGTTTTIAVTTTTKHGGLAFTGADITVTVGTAAIALGAGGMLVLASRKRKAAR